MEYSYLYGSLKGAVKAFLRDDINRAALERQVARCESKEKSASSIVAEMEKIWNDATKRGADVTH